MKTLTHSLRGSMLGATVLAAFCVVCRPTSAGVVTAIWNSASDVPVVASNYTATGHTVDFTLKFAPDTGTDLMVVRNAGLDFIVGAFDNLTNGQPVTLSCGGTNYLFVANYYGGTGNDLVLVWACNRVFAWGGNYRGQVGDNTTTNRLLPVPVTATGALAGKTLVAIAADRTHSLALCSDGTLAAWGANDRGQLGDNTGGNYGARSLVPMVVNRAPGVSALAGKSVVAIACGEYHSLALCSDGTVAAWGDNS